jgi:putative SbcD/Mre11-related phosphoesterase
MNIGDGIELVGHALFLSRYKALVASDLHIGYEESLNRQGVLVPRQQKDKLEQGLVAVVRACKPAMVVLNGDVKDEFGRISDQEWRVTAHLLYSLRKLVREVILIKGNHDAILEPLAEKHKLPLRESLLLGDVLITHGHEIPEDGGIGKAATIVIGHEHPAVIIADTIRSEIFKCFLVGRWHRKRLIVTPSFNPLVEGNNVLYQPPLSPFIENIENFKVYVVPGNGVEKDLVKEGDDGCSQEAKVYFFGCVKQLRALNAGN